MVIPEKIGLTIDIHLDEIQINIYDPTNLYIEYLFQCPMYMSRDVSQPHFLW